MNDKNSESVNQIKIQPAGEDDSELEIDLASGPADSLLADLKIPDELPLMPGRSKAT